MILTQQNAKGGRKITSFPIDCDPNTGLIGYKIGYCSCGCNEPILIRTIDVQQIVDRFDKTYPYGIKPATVRAKEKLIRALGGVVV